MPTPTPEEEGPVPTGFGGPDGHPPDVKDAYGEDYEEEVAHATTRRVVQQRRYDSEGQQTRLVWVGVGVVWDGWGLQAVHGRLGKRRLDGGLVLSDLFLGVHAHRGATKVMIDG